MFRNKTIPAPSKSPVHKPGGKANDANSLSSLGGNGAASNAGPPVLGKVNPSHLLMGNKVWVSDAKVLWRIGEVHSLHHEQQTADVYIPDAPDEKLQTLSFAKLYTFDASHIVDHDDIALMNNMHEAPLLNVLRQRFENDAIYTFTADILLSINPYKTIPLLYDVMGFMEQNSGERDASKRPPHLFTIAEKAYSGMKGVLPGTGTPQSIIVSGESGAGKTEASKYIMKYLATASKHVTSASNSAVAAAASVHEKIEECVVLSNLILESFGNAKTSRNDNSSRFGKYIQIHYNDDGRMVGVSIRHFLLEKTRLVMPQANERNYHIFYQLLAGLQSVEGSLNDGEQRKKQLKLQADVWNYTYLTHGDCVEVDGVDDAVEFEQLRSCLAQLGMDNTSFQMPMFEILAAILHLGNVQFQSVKTDDGSSEEKTTVVFPEEDQGVDLEHVSALLGVEPQEFAKKMVTQTTITGRGSILEIHLSADQAKNAMDAFCKHLYGELFNHLIDRINACAKEYTAIAQDTKPRGGSSSKKAAGSPAFIGILDIFGFEVMKKNSLEQLCINFTNETLQQQFNKHVFVLEQERYANEGIAFSIVEFKDNQACLDLIQKPPTGLLPLLEEQMLLKRKTTDKQLLTIYHGQHLDKHVNYTKPRFECDEFVIRHYAGEVVYDIHDFIAKNTDNLHDDLLDLLKRSSQTLVHTIFGVIPDIKTPQKRGAPASSTSNNKGKQGAALTGTSTVTSRFRTQLTELMDVLWNTTPNYIKCIKPNNLKFPGGFSCELVRDQLIYSGVLEVVRIRQEGFPIRKRFDVFYELFWPLAIAKYPVAVVRSDAKLLREACESISAEWLEREQTAGGEAATGKKVFAMGRQEVFLRYGQVEKLEAFVASLRSEKAVIIQAKLVRCRIAYKRYQALQKGTRKLQALWRMHTSCTRYVKMKKASVHIQAMFRRFRARTRFQKLKCAANCVFRVTMRFLTHKRFAVWEKQSKAVVMIQKHIRGFLSRTAVERARKLKERSVVCIQSWYRMAKHRRVYLRQHKAIIKIQSEYRSVKMRRDFLVRKHASIVLAAFVRQVIQRKKFKMLKQRVVKLQALVRKWKQRRQFRQLRSVTVFLQSKRRQLRAIQERTRRHHAMRMIQHAMKGWSCRCQFITMTESLRMLQYWAKSWLMRKEYRHMRAATTRIQRAWRKHHRLMRWENEVDSIFRSSGFSTIAGASSWTQHSKMEESDRRIQKLRQHPSLFFPLQPKAYGYNSLFHHAAACGDFHVVKYMLEHSQEFMTRHELFYLKNSKGNTAFHEACGHGQYEMVKFLMVQARIIADDERNKPLECTESTTSADAIVRQEKQPHDDANSNNSNQNQDQQPHEPFTKDPSALPKKANVEPQEDAAPGILYSGYLRKRRETSRWMRRFVVLNVNSETRFPQLEYFANDKPATLQGKSSKHIDLRAALFKKSMDTPFAFEIHSPHLLEGRNKEGRLYFAAENELEIQKWLAHLRNSIPSSIESRIFAMHRGTKYGKLEFVDFQLRKTICNLENRSRHKETPLHLAASVSMASAAASNFGASLDGKATILEPAVTTSSISVSVDEESHHNNNNHSSSELCSPQSSKVPAGPEDTTTIAPVSPTVGKTKLEVEADIVRTVLWLIENGADINAMTAKKETALKRAIKANNLLVAKHLLDRGALATGLSPSEIEEAQRLKASLAKNAISSVGSSSLGSGSDRTASSRFGSSSSLRKIMGGATGGAGGTNGAGGPARESDMPLLFLLKQPGKTRNSSYVSVFLEHLGISTPQYLSRPRLIISVVDSQCNLVEMKQQVSIQPVVLPSSLLWSITWHMQTPLENLPHGACVILELTISPTVSANSATPASSAEDFVPVCWTYLQVDQRTANCMPLNAEMYKYPMDLTLKKLQRVDAFINGDVFVSQGPQ